MASRTLTQAELMAEARDRFGDDPKTWAFVCPNCKDVANAQDFIDAKADPNRVGQECIGRSLGALDKRATGTDGRQFASRGCDWAAYGLFRGPWFITIPDGKGGTRDVPSFALADGSAPSGTHVWEQHLVDILRLLAAGNTMEATATRLRLSIGQAKRYLAKALREHEVANRNALIHIACRDGILPLGQPRTTTPRKDLGPQETRVLHRIAAGDTYPQIGERLHLSPHTVASYMKRAIYARGAANAANLVYLAHQDGLLGKQPLEAADA